MTTGTSVHLAVFQIKEDRKTAEEILANPTGLASHIVQLGSGVTGTLYVKISGPGVPPWVGFLGSTVTPPLRVRTQNAGAVLLVQRGSRRFALTFGYGRALLQPGSYDERFGLHVAANSIDPSKVRALDHELVEVVSRHTREQTSRDTSMQDFGMDIEQAILHGMTGTPVDQTLGSRLSGRDALVANGPFTLKGLPAQLDRYIAQAAATTYKTRFGFIDHINTIRDPIVRATLDAALLARLQTPPYSRIWLAIPELIDWEHVKGFRYGSPKRPVLHHELHLNDYTAERGTPQALTLKQLRTDVVFGVSAQADETLYRWSIYRCLNAEIHENGDTYILTNGSWYRVSTDFVAVVSDYLQTIQDTSLVLPPYNDPDEGAYNTRAATTSGSPLALMDQNMILYGGSPGGIEFCDLYSKDKRIVHVKRYAGSGALSHLFGQAAVSASAFATDQQFRKLVNAKLPRPFRLPDSSKRPTPGEYEIVFGIISRSATRDTIPFFSRVNLRRVTQTLRAMGYTVTLALIADATPPPAKGPNATARAVPKRRTTPKAPVRLSPTIPKAP